MSETDSAKPLDYNSLVRLAYHVHHQSDPNAPSWFRLDRQEQLRWHNTVRSLLLTVETDHGIVIAGKDDPLQMVTR